jgi:hypothetical protein
MSMLPIFSLIKSLLEIDWVMCHNIKSHECEELRKKMYDNYMGAKAGTDTPNAVTGKNSSTSINITFSGLGHTWVTCSNFLLLFALADLRTTPCCCDWRCRNFSYWRCSRKR